MILDPSALSIENIGTKASLACLICMALPSLAIKDGWHLGADEAALRGYYHSSYVRLKKAAHDGDARAQNRIGNHYYIGLGVLQNTNRAARWYRRAAFNGNSDAQVNLGLLYANGKGVSLDLERAYGWFRFAQKNGNRRAKVWVEYMDERYSMAPNMIKDIEFRFRTLDDFK